MSLEKLEPLGSERFYDMMARLKRAGADELYALKAENWMDQASKMLGVLPTQVTIGYADTTDDDVERLNMSFVAKVQSGVAQDTVQRYKDDLSAIPAVKKDKDYLMFSEELMRCAHMFQDVKEYYPGLAGTWEKFFGDKRKPVFENIPQMVPPDETKRRQLFDAMAAIVSGRIPGSLKEYKDLILEANEQFYGGKAEELSDSLYSLTSAIVELKPPEPGGGEGDGEGEGEGSDWGELGEFFDEINRQERNTPTPIKSEKPFVPPKTPGLDLDKMAQLKEMEPDMVFPEGDLTEGYLVFRVPKAPGAEHAYQRNVQNMSHQIRMLRKIVEEFYKTKTITDRGLMTGRIDRSRVHRLNFGVPNVFQRHSIDSVGHADVVVLLDESGSMGSRFNIDMVDQVSYKGIPGLESKGGRQAPYLGEVVQEPNNTRVNGAMRLAIMLLEVSRKLAGFNLTVGGYTATSSHSLGPLQEAAQAIAEGSYGVNVIRVLGDKNNPYPIVSTTAVSANADYQAMHWAVERLKQSRARQRAILYLADGQISDYDNSFKKLTDKARANNITTFFMDMSGHDVFEGSMLEDVERQQVNSFKDIVTGLKRFLGRMAQFAGA